MQSAMLETRDARSRCQPSRATSGIIIVALARYLPSDAASDADQLIRVEDSSDSGAFVRLALNRHGPTGRFPLEWNSVTRQAIA
jgi:hypothetical protein